MATDSANSGEQKGIAPALRRRLQAQFEAGSQKANRGEFDYATDMFAACVTGDPANQIYLQAFLGNLWKKYGDNKKGAAMAAVKGVGIKGSIKKSEMQKDWPGVIKNGLEMLKLNPWDVGALTAMAAACEKLEFDENRVQLLQSAWRGNPTDPEVNRLCGRAMRDQGKYDEAMAHFRRVVQAKPGDEEAMQALRSIDAERAIKKGGFEDAQSSTDVMADKQLQRDRQGGGGGVQLTPEQQLERHLTKNPADVPKYLELANLHVQNQNLADAEKVLVRALEASGGELQIRERLEDLQLRRAREAVETAKKQAEAERTPQAIELYKQMKLELNNRELEFYRGHVQRYPSQHGYKYELAARMMKAGMHREAIPLLQEAQQDPKRKAEVLVALGECFCQIKQYKLGMQNFETALEHISAREMEMRKQTLLNASKVALLALKDIDKADKYASELAALDFGYKDVGKILEQIAAARGDDSSGAVDLS
jgi:tetratricopeptide (TPR) repeat protein